VLKKHKKRQENNNKMEYYRKQQNLKIISQFWQQLGANFQGGSQNSTTASQNSSISSQNSVTSSGNSAISSEKTLRSSRRLGEEARMEQLRKFQCLPGGRNYRPLVGGFAAAAYEAMKEHHYSEQDAVDSRLGGLNITD